jgi:Dyp-type peroxidase family
MLKTYVPALEVSDIQATVLRPRPSPYRGEYVILRIEDAGQGREMLRRMIPHVAPADDWWLPRLPGWLGIAFTYAGLKALGVPQASLDSFPVEFRQGMAARAAILHDFADNAPGNWEYPFGTADMHVALAIYSSNEKNLNEVLERARQSHHDLAHISVVFRMQFSELPGGRNPFGFKDGLHNPHVEGSFAQGNVTLPHAGHDPPIKAGEFVMGYPDELGQMAQTPIPEELRHNGTFLAFRKFHMDVAAFRKYLRAHASSPEEEELIAAKMVGRWRSGAPLVLAPERDDPDLGADPNRNNDFAYADDMKGLKCPFSAHIRRINPRDALKDDIVAVNLHHFLRRGTNYGPPLPEGVLEDDGADRGGVFLLIGAHLREQFEFVQSQWVTDGNFISHGTEQDPILGNNEGDGIFTIPRTPVRRRLHGLPRFVAVRGGEYCFMPGLRALRWICELDTEPPDLAPEARHRPKGSTAMDRNLYDRGLAKRRRVLGDAYVDRALDNVDDFSRDFQRLVTEYCWGEVWGDETLSPREHSILTLGIAAAIGKMGEFGNHFRGALTNGLTPNELRAVLTQITIYCGIAVGADCFQVAAAILERRQGKVSGAGKVTPALNENLDSLGNLHSVPGAT